MLSTWVASLSAYAKESLECSSGLDSEELLPFALVYHISQGEEVNPERHRPLASL